MKGVPAGRMQMAHCIKVLVQTRVAENAQKRKQRENRFEKIKKKERITGYEAREDQSSEGRGQDPCAC